MMKNVLIVILTLFSFSITAQKVDSRPRTPLPLAEQFRVSRAHDEVMTAQARVMQAENEADKKVSALKAVMEEMKTKYGCVDIDTSGPEYRCITEVEKKNNTPEVPQKK